MYHAAMRVQRSVVFLAVGIRTLSAFTLSLALVTFGANSVAHAEERWDYLFGGIKEGQMIAGSFGYSGLPRIEYHAGIDEGFSLGGAFVIDIGYYSPERGRIDLGMLLSAPMRFSLVRDSKLSAAIRLEPGVGYFLIPDFNFGVLVNVGMSLGFRVNERVQVGGGVDVPLAVAVDPFVLTFPVLLGPMLEIHPIKNLAVTVDLKVGPNVVAVSGDGDVEFGLKLAVGVAYQF